MWALPAKRQEALFKAYDNSLNPESSPRSDIHPIIQGINGNEGGEGDGDAEDDANGLGAAALTDEPSALTDEPSALPDEQSALTDEPLTLSDEPSALTDEPLTLSDEPCVAQPGFHCGLLSRFGEHVDCWSTPR